MGGFKRGQSVARRQAQIARDPWSCETLGWQKHAIAGGDGSDVREKHLMEIPSAVKGNTSGDAHVFAMKKVEIRKKRFIKSGQFPEPRSEYSHLSSCVSLTQKSPFILRLVALLR
ncbi:uncharacterized protein An02g04720 [Aspergillus niger]|uniref:Contig An02c0130, genomic contig n=2 Tax=Aspergillus niger TaxID=5061 RepID=A2QCU0_ASPNC|nr:uncharacterized protein An02g04720 [Aspergillus niger]CAK44197.1 unnamed protein product [Aspergillus niger]